jgi:hypothetical protein
MRMLEVCKIGNRKNSKFFKEYDQIWEQMEKMPLIKKLMKENGAERCAQIKHNISLYLRSQALTHFFGIENEEFKRALDKSLRSRKTRVIFFLDILGAHAWANPRFHSYLYEQIPAYIQRNHTNIWNLVIQDKLIKNKIEERLAKYVDVDDVMPKYNSGENIDLHIVRILSWSDEDMRSDVAKDLIDLHKISNMPLFYIPRKDLQIMLTPQKKVEFHLALDRNGNRLPDGCWIYEEHKKRVPYRDGMLPRKPEEIISEILKHDDCIFALEKRTGFF